MSTRPEFPVPAGRSSSYELGIKADSALGLPEATVVLSVWVENDGTPRVSSGSLRFEWPQEAEPPTVKIGQLRKVRHEVLDDGQVYVEFDSLDRVAVVEVSAQVPGPKFLPETVALHERVLQAGGGTIVLTGVATIMAYWPQIESHYARMAAKHPHSLAKAAKLAKKPATGRARKWDEPMAATRKLELW